MMNVKNTSPIGHARYRTLALMLAMSGCVAGAEGPNLAPDSLDEAGETIAYLDALLEANPNDPEALEMLEVLRPRLDELNHLVAEVDIAPGRAVRFYEVEPGVIGVSESAPEGESLLLSQEDAMNLPVSELYEELAGAPAPEALVQAELREEALREQVGDIDTIDAATLESAAPTPEAPRGVGVSRSALTSGHGTFFRDNYCFTYGEFRGCYPNGGGNVFAQTSTKTSFFTLAPYDGNVSIRLRYEGTTRFTDAVFQGEVRSFSWRSASYRTNGWLPFSPRDYRRRTHRWEVLNASGDRFHWAHAFRWSCSYTSCNGYPR